MNEAGGLLSLDPAWGAAILEGGLVLRPSFPAEVTTMAVSRVRVYRTVLDLGARRRPGRLVIRIARRFGPDLGVELAWAGPEPVASVLVDDHLLQGPAVRFVARHEHEAQFLLAEAPAP